MVGCPGIENLMHLARCFKALARVFVKRIDRVE